ncbi:MAG: cytidylate kinase family protein, partial [Deltaproteobacteria bacterium]|nr:cytidylate kinase family protein [Deltaproteobacteria bacterium]
AGHMFLKDVQHVLKIRIVADLETRVRLEMERERISNEEALSTLQKDDEERRRWSMDLYGVDPADPCLYDMVIHIRKFSVDDAVDMICHAAKLPPFQNTIASQRALEDLVLASQVKTRLVKNYSHLGVTAKDRVIYIEVDTQLYPKIESVLEREILSFLGDVPGVKEIKFNVPRLGFMKEI